MHLLCISHMNTTDRSDFIHYWVKSINLLSAPINSYLTMAFPQRCFEWLFPILNCTVWSLMYLKLACWASISCQWNTLRNNSPHVSTPTLTKPVSGLKVGTALSVEQCGWSGCCTIRYIWKLFLKYPFLCYGRVPCSSTNRKLPRISQEKACLKKVQLLLQHLR